MAVAVAIGAAGCGDRGGERPSSAARTAGGGGAATATITIAARDLVFEPKAVTAPAGTIAVNYVNEGQLQHTLLIAGQEKRLALAVTRNGDTDNNTVDLSPGEYVLYCDIPGHRAAGMEAKLTVR